MDRLENSLTLQRVARSLDQIDAIEAMLVADTPAEAVLSRFKDAEGLLEAIIEYQREDPTKASAHCMRRSCEAVLNVLRGVEL